MFASVSWFHRKLFLQSWRRWLSERRSRQEQSCVFRAFTREQLHLRVCWSWASRCWAWGQRLGSFHSVKLDSAGYYLWILPVTEGSLGGSLARFTYLFVTQGVQPAFQQNPGWVCALKLKESRVFQLPVSLLAAHLTWFSVSVSEQPSSLPSRLHGLACGMLMPAVLAAASFPCWLNKE